MAGRRRRLAQLIQEENRAIFNPLHGPHRPAMTFNKKAREELRMMFGGKCAYCGCELNGRWHADHKIPIGRRTKYIETPECQYSYKLVPTGELDRPDMDTKENIVPCCCSCNINKGPLSLITWRKQLEDITGILQRGYPTYRHAVRFGQVVEVAGPIVFWYEKYRALEDK